MKKYINIAFIYSILAMVSGVFYREFTKILGYRGKTSLAVTHVHLFMLGTIIFLIIALFSINTDLTSQKQFKVFMPLYNLGLSWMVVMYYVRGIIQVLGTELSKGANAAVSGIAGMGHIILGVGVVYLFLALKKTQINK